MSIFIRLMSFFPSEIRLTRREEKQMKHKNRLTLALLVAGGLLAVVDAAKVVIEPNVHQTRQVRAPKPVN